MCLLCGHRPQYLDAGPNRFPRLWQIGFFPHRLSKSSSFLFALGTSFFGATLTILAGSFSFGPHLIAPGFRVLNGMSISPTVFRSALLTFFFSCCQIFAGRQR
jgi:hypothetical protein